MNTTELIDNYGFTLAGRWELNTTVNSGVKFSLNSLETERVLYAFVENNIVRYVGICDSLKTKLL